MTEIHQFAFNILQENTYLYTDHFHPNEAGYARIAERIMQALQ